MSIFISKIVIFETEILFYKMKNFWKTSTAAPPLLIGIGLAPDGPATIKIIFKKLLSEKTLNFDIIFE